MDMLIAGRGTRCFQYGLTNPLIPSTALQGAGAGGIQASSLIIVADLIPLRQRGFLTSINNL